MPDIAIPSYTYWSAAPYITSLDFLNGHVLATGHRTLSEAIVEFFNPPDDSHQGRRCIFDARGQAILVFDPNSDRPLDVMAGTEQALRVAAALAETDENRQAVEEMEMLARAREIYLDFT